MLHNMHEPDRLRFMAATLDCIGDGVIATDCNGAVLYINASGEKLTGWSGKEAEGKPFCDVFRLVDFFSGKRLDNPVRAALENGETVGLKNHSALITKEGKTLYVSASCSPIRGPGGAAEGAVVVFRYIDRIKTMEEETTKEKNSLKSVLESLPIGILLVGEDAVVTWVNKPLLELFRIREADIVGRCFGDGLGCSSCQEGGCGKGESCGSCEIRQNIGKAILNQASLKDVVLRRSFFCGGAAADFWMKFHFIPLAVSDDKQIVIAVEDITEQKNHEAALQRGRDEAESANRVKSEFLANMSHEIRTPLNGLIGMMDLLLMTETSEEQKEYVRMAKFSANTLLNVINDILDFSRIEAGKITIANVPFDLKALSDDIMKIHAVLSEKKGLKLLYSFSPGIPSVVSGDPDRLRQILNNLIGNAVKFTDTGQIGVSVSKTGETPQSVELEFLVSDTGIGISEEKMDLLFKRFSQVDGSVTRRYSGTGLGLAICKQLAELMGGTIGAKSEIGKGSAFRFTVSFGTVGDCAANSVPAIGQTADKPLSPIVMDDSELAQLIPAATVGRGDQTVVFANQTFERPGRIRLGENGEIVFGTAAETASGEDMARGVDAIKMLLLKMQAMLLKGSPAMLEETAHMAKETALGIGLDDLMELAFKIELAARKRNWDFAKDHCMKMEEAFNNRYGREKR